MLTESIYSPYKFFLFYFYFLNKEHINYRGLTVSMSYVTVQLSSSLSHGLRNKSIHPYIHILKKKKTAAFIDERSLKKKRNPSSKYIESIGTEIRRDVRV